jgi:hypothetical protein
MAVEGRVRWLGGVLIVAVIAAIVVRSMDVPAAPAAPRNGQARGAVRASARDSGQSPSNVNLATLERERGEPAARGRNPFRFQASPAPATPPPAAAKPPGPGAGSTTPSLPPGPPPPPPIALKFIGLVQKADGTRIAVLSDGKRPIHGIEGQDIEGQYRILRIGVESLEIAYLDGRGRQTIKLTGQ